MFAYLAKFVKAGQNLNCTHKQLHLNWKMDIASFTVVYRDVKKKKLYSCWLIDHTHTVKLRVSYMPLNVNTLCMWSAPPSDSEHVKNNSSFSSTVCLRVPLTTSALTPSVSLRCLKRPNEYWWAERSACSNQWPAKYNKNCSSLPVTSIKHWFGNADILLRPFYFPSSSWL